MTYAPTTIDLTRIAPPAVIEGLTHERFRQEFIFRFGEQWDVERGIDPSLPVWDVGGLEANPAARVGARAFSYIRLLDHQRVNDAIKALLAPLATGSDLDNLVARQNVQRLVVRAATADAPAVMESDAALLRRYLLSFDMASAGSADRYLYEANKVWPQSEDKTLGLWDARVNGFDVHGRRGDTDVVIIGPFGRLPTSEERAAVSAAVRSPHVKPEAVSVAVLNATRAEYEANLVIEIAPGPDASVVQAEAVARVRAAGIERTLIGGEVPDDFIPGAAYGPNVIKVRDLSPVVIEPDPYTVPVLTNINITVEVRG
ncbi:baseplate J/gp47 family protein [Tianweitania sediminis]|uniref:Baseplate J/gp47 family protein n=1 Tax=Tianweitania sediminis TaxID=1502156 RepID=A0A8J7UIX1_9HYPH|nr:baseplate J/gp47 family protein [Tianweitania sediminis]MBP0440689.1 baseplate J/gp47 family protein [Tianweitania sediminis]